jgi:hypothetical protein
MKAKPIAIDGKEGQGFKGLRVQRLKGAASNPSLEPFHPNRETLKPLCA